MLFAGRVCFMGLGNVDGGDDGFGVRLAEALARAGVPDVVIAGTAPERLAGRCADRGFDHLVFLDAVDFGAAPGSVVFLNSQEMAARFPQISTHQHFAGIAGQVRGIRRNDAGLAAGRSAGVLETRARAFARLQTTWHCRLIGNILSGCSALGAGAHSVRATAAEDCPACPHKTDDLSEA